MPTIKNFLLYILFALAMIMIYTEVSHFWVACGGINGYLINIEIPILIVLLLFLYFPKTTAKKNALLSAFSIVSLYILYDVFYHFLAKSPRPSDLVNAKLLSDFSPLFSIGLFVMVLFILMPFIYQSLVCLKNGDKKDIYKLFTLKAIIMIGILFGLASESFRTYLSTHFNHYIWSQSRTIKKNGRISSFIYYGILSKQAKDKLASYQDKDIDIETLLFNNTHIQNKRNIYIVILESFIDPRLLKDVNFTKSPLHEELNKYLNKGEFSYTKASIYGGGTAQSEFEILTGMQALAKVNSIEFNTLQGGHISGFIHALKQNGYASYATIASSSKYYNSKDAYKSIGFDETLFLEECDAFTMRKEDVKIFDGDVYDFNIKRLKAKKLKQPFVHYTLGMYGHFPYHRNIPLRPDVLSSTHPDKRIHKIANQFYYRTKALARYMDEIFSIDKTAIVYVTSDHLPPLFGKNITYSKEQTENIALLYVDKKVIDVTGKTYYDIPRVIYKLLQDKGRSIKPIAQEQMHEMYFKALSQSLQ